MSAEYTLTHNVGRSVDVHFDSALLFTYSYQTDVPANETPKPFFHPLRTLGGETTTVFRPVDHPWHAGLTFTLPRVGEDNFWGGNSYVPGTGYIQLPNNGSIRHDHWSRMQVLDSGVSLDESLSWVSISGEVIFQEDRAISSSVSANRGHHTLELTFSLLNVTDRDLVLGSSATEGFENLGYWGMHWRGARSLAPGRLLAPGGVREVNAINSHSHPWVAYSGDQDGTGNVSTLVFVDCPREQRFPTQWFAHAEGFPSITASFVYDETYTLPASERLTLTHQVVVIDGEPDESTIDHIVTENLKHARKADR